MADLDTLGFSLIVGGMALFVSGLIFLLPKEWGAPTTERSAYENIDKIEEYFQRMRRDRGAELISNANEINGQTSSDVGDSARALTIQRTGGSRVNLVVAKMGIFRKFSSAAAHFGNKATKVLQPMAAGQLREHSISTGVQPS